ncbi:hypothetical protein CEXT_522851 [Caerostris extrusa]|uniref:Uncharacterized protein n=1 Tax=Caerostris extrusa TaxID=172846 RepID=A0AAV4NRS2_CAEEX|nr:hypothetical protein CEXT_522851 [Caerostris extrusa]
MSGSRYAISDNQASASENESDRYSSPKQYAVHNNNKSLQPQQVSDEPVSLSNQKQKSLSSLQLNHTDSMVQDISAVDSNVPKNSPNASSDKETGSLKNYDVKSIHSITPSVVLNSVSSSVSSLQNVSSSKESPRKIMTINILHWMLGAICHQALSAKKVPCFQII